MDNTLQSWWKLLQIPGIGLMQLHRLRQSLALRSDLYGQDTEPRAKNVGDNTVNNIDNNTDNNTALINLYHLDDEALIKLGLHQKALTIFRQPLTQDQRARLALINDWVSTPSRFILGFNDSDFPQALASLNDAPLFVFGSGQRQAVISPSNKKKVAIVGSRRATPAGLRWTQTVARELADAGVTVVSGLAIGIDGAAHQGALESQQDYPTIAILGSGLNSIYPYQHTSLAEQITRRGCLLSEYFPAVPPRPQHFPARNRLISGLVDGVVIVEAQLNSGTMITARLAADQGREVMAVPGAIAAATSQGPHQLIKDGAALVETSQDILSILGIGSYNEVVVEKSYCALAINLPTLANDDTSSSVAATTPTVVMPTGVMPTGVIPTIVSCIDFTPTQVDVIALRMQCPLPHLLVDLTELELAGWIKQVAGGYIRIK